MGVEKGVLIIGVNLNGFVEKVGIYVGDIILKIDNIEVVLVL